MKITRDDILKAIAVEPLVAGTWAHEGVDGICAYCAVGAVLVSKGLYYSKADGQVTQDFFEACRTLTKSECNDDDSLVAALRNQNYLGALSIKFERLASVKASTVGTQPLYLSSAQVESLREPLRNWVLETLPSGVLYDDAV